MPPAILTLTFRVVIKGFEVALVSLRLPGGLRQTVTLGQSLPAGGRLKHGGRGVPGGRGDEVLTRRWGGIFQQVGVGVWRQSHRAIAELIEFSLPGGNGGEQSFHDDFLPPFCIGNRHQYRAWQVLCVCGDPAGR
jgi:hypothetical protein